MRSNESKRREGRVRGGGFSLIELLVTLALTSIVLVAVFAAMDSQARSQAATEQLADINQNLRVAVETVVRDVRVAGLRTVAQPSIAQAGPFQLALYADVNRSCLCGASALRTAEDVCWGYRSSTDGSAPTPVPAPPVGSCPSLDATSLPYGDSPNGVTFYADGVIPADPTNVPSHAELIVWTFDSDGNASPFTLDDDFDSADEALLQIDGGSGNCPASGINASDVDSALGVSGNSLMNLYRIEYRNDTTLDATGNVEERARVAKGLVGPCDDGGAISRPTDEIGNIWPAFSYWIDVTRDKEITSDCDGTQDADEDLLWGDTNFDCVFSAAEFDALTAVPRVNAADQRAILDNIVRVDVHLLAQSSELARAGAVVGGSNVSYRERHLASAGFVRTER